MFSCDKCNERAIYSRRYSGQKFCEQHFIRYFETKVNRTIFKEDMIERGDFIAVGLSGGKDSLATLYLLNKIKNRLKIKLHAIAIDEGIESYRKKTLDRANEFCNSNKIPISIVSIERYFGFTLDDTVNVGKNKACTYCGVLRRKILNNKSLEIGADKLATGHNLDDQVQAIMMNYISGDISRIVRFASNTPNTGLVKRIKPLCEMPEKEVAIYATLKNLGPSYEECPYTHDSRRNGVKSWLNDLERDSPGIKYSILQGYRRILIHLDNIPSGNLKQCKKCGDVSSQDYCRACSLIKEVKSDIQR